MREPARPETGASSRRRRGCHGDVGEPELGRRPQSDSGDGQDVPMRILLWHGYLLGGTGSNVYTRQLAREWSAGRTRRRRAQPGAGARSGTTSAAPATVRPDVGGLLPVFVLDRYEGYEVRRVPDCTRGRARDAGSRRTPPPYATSCRRTSSSRTTSCSAARSASRAARRSPSRPTAPSSSTRCAGNPELSAWGRECLARRDRHLRRLRPHPARRRGRLRPRRPRPRGPARRRHRRLAARRSATSRARPPPRRGRGATRRTRATPRSGCPTRATPDGSAPSSPATGRPSSTSAS